MKCILSRSLVLSFCLLLSLPAVADAFLKRDKAAPVEAAPKKAFIAVSESPMNWHDAVAYCRQQGGRLPLINGAASLAWAQVRGTPGTVLIDGFGQINVGPNWPADFTTPWPSGLPGDGYWTGTELAAHPDRSWAINGSDGIVGVGTAS